MSPTVIAYSETYNAIQSGVIAALDNEALGMIQMKFYEVAPQVSLAHFAARISKENLGQIESFCAAGICVLSKKTATEVAVFFFMLQFNASLHLRYN